MNIKEFLTDKFDLESDKNNLWGDINSFGVIISIYNSNINIRISFDNRNNAEHIKSILSKYKENNSISSFTRQAFGVDIEIKNELIADNIQIKDFLENFTSELLDLKLSNTCTTCHEPSQITFIKINNQIINNCERCINKLESEISQVIGRPNNYILATIGAFLGAMIGSIAWIIIGYIGFVSSIGGVAIAYAAITGYDFFKGKQSKLKALILAVSIIFGVFFAEYIGVMMSSFKLDPSWTISLWIQQTPYLFLEDNLLNDMLPSIGMGLLFAGIGTFKMIKEIFTDKEIVPKLENL